MQRTVWRTSMYRYWINRRKLWFKSMVMCLFSVYWYSAHECFLSCDAFALYLLCMWFHVSKMKSEREREWGSIVSLSEPGDSCIDCSWIHPHRVCWWRLRSLTFVLACPEWICVVEAMQGVRANTFERIRVRKLRRYSTFLVQLKESPGGLGRGRFEQRLQVQVLESGFWKEL